MFFNFFPPSSTLQQSKRRAHRICSEVRKLLAAQRQQAHNRQVDIPALVIPNVDAIVDVALPGNDGLTTVQLRCIKPDDPLHSYWLKVKLMGNHILSISIDKGDSTASASTKKSES